MWSDQEPTADGRVVLFGWDLPQDPSKVRLSLPLATITRERQGTHGGLPMARQIMAGNAVSLFWPGTGPIDSTERAALKALYSVGIPKWTWDFLGYGSSGGMHRDEFVADHSNTIDPCGGSGNVSSRLDGVTCIGGHVVGLLLHSLGGAHLRSVPAGAGGLTHLKSFVYMDTYGSTDQSPILHFDSATGNWSQLQSFVYCAKNSRPGQKLALPAAVAAWQNLSMITIHSMGIHGEFPAGFFSLPKLQSVLLNSVPLAELPSVASMANLAVFVVADNGLKAAMPSFRGLSKLSVISFLGNSLTGGTMDSFDGCTSLQSINARDNRLASELFSFVGCTELTSIDLSLNKLHGKIPLSWSSLKKVRTLRLSRNAIGGPNTSFMGPIFGMSSMIEFDISHNLLQFEAPGCQGYECKMFEEWVGTWLTNNLKLVDVSHNEIGIGMDYDYDKFPGWHTSLGARALRYPNILSFKASHNQIRGAVRMDGITHNIDLR
jgi:hypothetical protein